MFAWSPYEALGVDPNFICHRLNIDPRCPLKKHVVFTDLNKARSKDPFLVPKIIQLVDATFGHPKMSFLNAFQG